MDDVVVATCVTAAAVTSDTEDECGTDRRVDSGNVCPLSENRTQKKQFSHVIYVYTEMRMRCSN